MLVRCLERHCGDFVRDKLASGGCGYGRDTSMALDLASGFAYVSFMVTCPLPLLLLPRTEDGGTGVSEGKEQSPEEGSSGKGLDHGGLAGKGGGQEGGTLGRARGPVGEGRVSDAQKPLGGWGEDRRTCRPPVALLVAVEVSSNP